MEMLGFNPEQQGAGLTKGDRNREEEKSLLQTLRETSPAARALIVGFALEIASFVWHAEQKVQEYGQIGKKEEYIDKKLEAQKSLGGKMQELKLLFGEHVESDLNFRSETEEWQAKKQEAQKEREEFAFFESKRKIEDIEEGAEMRNKQEQENKPMSVSDFVVNRGAKAERIISQESLGQYFGECLPRSFVEGEVASITQSNEAEEIRADYGLTKGTEAFASCYHGGQQEKARIVFHSISKESSLPTILRVAGHEIAHANSWKTDNEMNTEERMDLLLSISKRLRAGDRYMSNYVESINNEDGQLENYNKATEYWAEICEQYFSDPNSLNVKDWEIVDDMIKKQDPKFDLDETLEARHKLFYAYDH
ncbi:MAG: hypothetical protein HY454_02860 [Parcubacteria group bacterium]|nr:hypothetical protein [Parcubacteria group bacterium]